MKRGYGFENEQEGKGLMGRVRGKKEKDRHVVITLLSQKTKFSVSFKIMKG